MAKVSPKVKTRGNSVTCLGCGWVYFSVSAEYARAEIRSSNKFLKSLSKEDRAHYGKPLTLDFYKKCHCGNSYKNFRDSKKGDMPDGCTINPILRRDE